MSRVDGSADLSGLSTNALVACLDTDVSTLRKLSAIRDAHGGHLPSHLMDLYERVVRRGDAVAYEAIRRGLAAGASEFNEPMASLNAVRAHEAGRDE